MKQERLDRLITFISLSLPGRQVSLQQLFLLLGASLWKVPSKAEAATREPD